MVTINYRDGRPIYEQVQEDLRQLVFSGALPPGERLPSVRELAGQLAINPNTIQRAYRELEQEGTIVSVPGKGSFACEQRGPDRTRQEALLRQMDSLVRELLWLGVPADEICGRVRGGREKCQ